MSDSLKGFQIIRDVEPVVNDASFGHATVVRKRSALDKDIVVKEINQDGVFDEKMTGEDRKNWWLESQKNAALISDEIRAKNNPAYFVPRTYISHGKVYEEFASGNRWRDIYKDISSEDLDWIFMGLAKFINDMSELRPIKYVDKVSKVCGLPQIKSSYDLQRKLSKVDEKYISAKNKKLIQDIYDYLLQVPENKIMVFGHNDLHGDNIIIDIDEKQLSIIDFECAGYESAFKTMYVRGMFDYPFFWQCINELPRTKNSNFSWGFVSEHRDLYKFLRWLHNELLRNGKSLESMSREIAMKCGVISFIFEDAKFNQQEKIEKQKMPMVKMSHYEKE